MSVLLFNYVSVVFLCVTSDGQVVMGIMVGSPGTDTRLSEEVISAAIVKFYKMHHTVPLGVAESVIEKWGAKMASAAVRCTSRFKRLYWASEGAKEKGLREMKVWVTNELERKKAGDGSDQLQVDEAPADPGSIKAPADSVSILNDPGFDWESLEKKLADLNLNASKVELPSRSGSDVSEAKSPPGLPCHKSPDKPEKKENQLTLPKQVFVLADCLGSPS